MSKAPSQWERLLRALIPLLMKPSIAADRSTLQAGAQRPAGSDDGVTKQRWTSHNNHSMKTKALALSAEPLFPKPENLITDVRSISSPRPRLARPYYNRSASIDLSLEASGKQKGSIDFLVYSEGM